MMQAIINMNEKLTERVETRVYDSIKVIYIDCKSVPDAVKLLTDHAADPGEPYRREEPKKEEKPSRYRMIDLETVNDFVRSFEESEEGKNFLRTAKESDDIPGNLKVNEALYLEALVLSGRTFEAISLAYEIGKSR